jgi:hypothetical protein
MAVKADSTVINIKNNSRKNNRGGKSSKFIMATA